MSYITNLKAEIANDPKPKGYASQIPPGNPSTDEIHKNPAQQAACQAIADLLNEKNISVPNVLSKEQLVAAIDATEFAGLSQSEIDLLNILLDNNSSFAPDDAQVLALFAGKTATLANLSALSTKLISRWEEEAGLKPPSGYVRAGEVAMARAKP